MVNFICTENQVPMLTYYSSEHVFFVFFLSLSIIKPVKQGILGKKNIKYICHSIQEILPVLELISVILILAAH